MFAKNSRCAYPRTKWTAAMALEEHPLSIGHITGQAVHCLTSTRREVRMADGYSKEEIEEMVAKSVERAMNGILMVAITETVHCAVTRAMNEYQHECVLDLNKPEVEAVQNLVDVIRATGHGDVARGVEEIRENHSFIAGIRKRCEQASTTVVQTVTKTLTTVVFLAIALGVCYLFIDKVADFSGIKNGKIGV